MKHDAVSVYINSLAEAWQREVCQELRKLIHEPAPRAVESIKWGAPFFEAHGPLCSISTTKKFVRLVFMRGAELPTSQLFASGDAQQLRTIRITEGQMVPAQEIIGLVREAVKLNHK